jgi:hypothetical protein
VFSFVLVLRACRLPPHVFAFAKAVAQDMQTLIPALRAFCRSKVVIKLNVITIFGRCINWGKTVRKYRKYIIVEVTRTYEALEDNASPMRRVLRLLVSVLYYANSRRWLG